MKKNYRLLLFLLLGTLFIACKKDGLTYENEYDKSFKAWKNFKASTNNSYQYQVTSGSWTGYSSETTITVKDGKVIKRSYLAKTIERPSNQVVVHEEWTENEATINSHNNGASAITLDAIYQKAKTDWLLKRKDASTYFEVKNDGMISSCGYVEKNCMDDCFNGVHIAFIKKLP